MASGQIKELASVLQSKEIWAKVGDA